MISFESKYILVFQTAEVIREISSWIRNEQDAKAASFVSLFLCFGGFLAYQHIPLNKVASEQSLKDPTLYNLKPAGSVKAGTAEP